MDFCKMARTHLILIPSHGILFETMSPLIWHSHLLLTISRTILGVTTDMQIGHQLFRPSMLLKETYHKPKMWSRSSQLLPDTEAHHQTSIMTTTDYTASGCRGCLSDDHRNHKEIADKSTLTLNEFIDLVGEDKEEPVGTNSKSDKEIVEEVKNAIEEARDDDNDEDDKDDEEGSMFHQREIIALCKKLEKACIQKADSTMSLINYKNSELSCSIGRMTVWSRFTLTNSFIRSHRYSTTRLDCHLSHHTLGRGHNMSQYVTVYAIAYI